MKYVVRSPREGINVSDVDPRKEALVLVGGVGLVAALVVAVIAFSVDVVITLVPPSWEVRLFRGVAARLTDTVGTAKNTSTPAVQALMDRLASHWPDNPYDFRIGVITEETPNALALPGGAVLVTTGLLKRVESENELAFVLGHEIGHFQNRDHLQGLGRQVATTLALAVVTGSAAGSGAELLGLIQLITERRFSRAQELEADRIGLGIVHREYGHLAAAWDFFEHLPNRGFVLSQRFANYLATHPVTEERVAALSRIAQERGWSTLGKPQPFQAKQAPGMQ